jgi:hypothetical protein
LPVYITAWISQSTSLIPISACDPAYIWLQSTQDPLQGRTASSVAQATPDHRALISAHLQLKTVQWISGWSWLHLIYGMQRLVAYDSQYLDKFTVSSIFL